MRRKQLIRGNTAFNNSYVGNPGEITIDLQTKEIRVHDGSTPGGVVIPNTATIPGLSRKIFSTVDTIAAPGNLVAADSDKLLTLAAAGTYILPDVGGIGLAVGTQFWFHAPVAGISIRAFNGSQHIGNRAASVYSYSLSAGETIHLGLITTVTSPSWRILSSY